MNEETDDASVVALLEEWFDEASKQLEALGHPDAWTHTQVRPHPTGPKDAFFYDVDQHVPPEAENPLVWTWGRIAHMAKAGMHGAIAPHERATYVLGVMALVERKDAVVAHLEEQRRQAAAADHCRSIATLPRRSRGGPIGGYVEDAWTVLYQEGQKPPIAWEVLYARLRKEYGVRSADAGRVSTGSGDSLSVSRCRAILAGLNTAAVPSKPA